MKELKTALLANGCFWCSDAVFRRVKGIEKVVSGFSGGHIKNPAYREVVTQRTGHAETIKISYDPEQISYRDILMIFFTTHDPTSLNRQGNDVGTHYRSAIFYLDEEQQKTAEEVIQELNHSVFEGKIVTQLEEAGPFYEAEPGHQNFYNLNQEYPYCQAVINPKLQKLRAHFSAYLKAD